MASIRKAWSLFISIFGGALAGVGLAHGIFGNHAGAYVLLGLGGAVFFTCLVARTGGH